MAKAVIRNWSLCTERLATVLPIVMADWIPFCLGDGRVLQQSFRCCGAQPVQFCRSWGLEAMGKHCCIAKASVGLTFSCPACVCVGFWWLYWLLCLTLSVHLDRYSWMACWQLYCVDLEMFCRICMGFVLQTTLSIPLRPGKAKNFLEKSIQSYGHYVKLSTELCYSIWNCSQHQS